MYLSTWIYIYNFSTCVYIYSYASARVKYKHIWVLQNSGNIFYNWILFWSNVIIIKMTANILVNYRKTDEICLVKTLFG